MTRLTANCFTGFVQFRAPTKLRSAIATIADRKMMSVSEYTRRAVIEKLKADGLDIEEMNADVNTWITGGFLLQPNLGNQK